MYLASPPGAHTSPILPVDTSLVFSSARSRMLAPAPVCHRSTLDHKRAATVHWCSLPAHSNVHRSCVCHSGVQPCRCCFLKASGRRPDPSFGSHTTTPHTVTDDCVPQAMEPRSTLEPSVPRCPIHRSGTRIANRMLRRRTANRMLRSRNAELTGSWNRIMGRTGCSDERHPNRMLRRRDREPDHQVAYRITSYQ